MVPIATLTAEPDDKGRIDVRVLDLLNILLLGVLSLNLEELDDEGVEVLFFIEGEIDHLPALVGVGVDQLLVSSLFGEVFGIGVTVSVMQPG